MEKLNGIFAPRSAFDPSARKNVFDVKKIIDIITSYFLRCAQDTHF